MFLKISQISQENTCLRTPFLQNTWTATFGKKVTFKKSQTNKVDFKVRYREKLYVTQFSTRILKWKVGCF